MSLSRNVDRTYTIADIESWPEDVRVELIDGVLYHTYGGVYNEDSPVMQAAPAPVHQIVSRNLFRQIDRFLEGKPCQAFYAPFAVYLNADSTGDTETYVEPDIAVVCDKTKIDDKGYKGAPDLVIEILSPSTAKKDRIIKYQAYLSAGVPEYWIVEPDIKTITALVLKGTIYEPTFAGEDDLLEAQTLKGCTVDVGKIFDLGEA